MGVTGTRSRGMLSLFAWLVAGGVITFFGLSLPTVGLAVLAIAIVAAALTNWNWALPWLLVGTTLPVLWIAWKNRGGPGEDCFVTPSMSGCRELLDPLPWFASGLVLLALSAGMLLLGLKRAQERERAR